VGRRRAIDVLTTPCSEATRFRAARRRPGALWTDRPSPGRYRTAATAPAAADAEPTPRGARRVPRNVAEQPAHVPSADPNAGSGAGAADTAQRHPGSTTAVPADSEIAFRCPLDCLKSGRAAIPANSRCPQQTAVWGHTHSRGVGVAWAGDLRCHEGGLVSMKYVVAQSHGVSEQLIPVITRVPGVHSGRPTTWH
jgi:hypothetical protein